MTNETATAAEGGSHTEHGILGEEVELRRPDVVKLIGPYAEARAAEFGAKRDKERVGSVIRQFLEEHPEETLYDGELGLEAMLKQRTGPSELDIIGLAEKHPQIVVRLAELGLLRLDNTGWRAQKEKFPEAVTIQGFISPGKGSVALNVEVKR